MSEKDFEIANDGTIIRKDKGPNNRKLLAEKLRSGQRVLLDEMKQKDVTPVKETNIKDVLDERRKKSDNSSMDFLRAKIAQFNAQKE